MNTLNRGYRLKKKRFERIAGTLILLSFFFIWNYNEQVSLSLSEAKAVEITAKIEQVESKDLYIDNVNERAFEFIISFEGFHDKPYWDFKQWSCGYGMKCSKDTKNITREKSKGFVIDRIQSIRDRYNFHSLDDNLEVALISFTYNIGQPPSGYMWYIENGYTNALKNRMREYSYAGNKKLRGLEKRREAEVNLF